MTTERRELLSFARRLAKLGLAVLVLLVLGSIGYSRTEHVNLWDAFAWALDTVATTGSVAAPHDTAGQIVKVALTLLGVGTLFYALVTVTELFVAGHLGALLSERRNRRHIDRMAEHYVICGYGRVGRQVARDLRASGARYVVIDPDPMNVEAAQAHVGVRAIQASPSDDEALRSAGIMRAQAVLACVDSDAENIFITLTARELAPEIAIVARASMEDSESKLRRAGADRVISPYKASGIEMARLALHPQVSGAVTNVGGHRLEEIEIRPGCDGAGHALADIRGSAIIVGLKRGERFVPQPPGDVMLEDGDVLIAMGTDRAMDRLEALFDATGRPTPAREATGA